LKELRGADYVFRYGGEEFLCMLPETGLATACAAAERLRITVQTETDVTISLGVAAFTDDMPDKDTLIQKADEALYRAKENGRNRVEQSVE
jgi:diguanylate cyclase (GGDEF)-like protein